MHIQFRLRLIGYNIDKKQTKGFKMRRENIEIDPKIDYLDVWFDIPYVMTRGDVFAVMCFDGGASDRASVKGFFDTKEMAFDFILENY